MKLIVSLSPGPFSTTEAWYVPAGAVACPLDFPPHELINGKTQSRPSINRSPRLELRFFRRVTANQAGNHRTAPRATPPDQGQGFCPREAARLLTGLIVSVVLAVLLDAKLRLLGVKLQVMYCERLAGRLHSSAIMPAKSVAVHVIVADAESPDRVTVGTLQLTLGGGSAMPES